MIPTINLVFAVAVAFLIGMLFGYAWLRLTFVEPGTKTSIENLSAMYVETRNAKTILETELNDSKIWITDAEIYIQELELENLALNGTKSRATITMPEEVGHTKEKKVVHKRARKVK